ncbi:hypothetical protein BMS3Abin16_01297 [archaeon BMS3Abin16]|nr:hypothetical protein BMS3Abin16_01297 [archaeon BMS3Abin16]
MVLAVVIIGLTVSVGYSVYSLQKERSEVHMPIEADENLANESGRITRVSLKLPPGTDAYVWDIELMERTCGAARLEGMGSTFSEPGLTRLQARYLIYQQGLV